MPEKRGNTIIDWIIIALIFIFTWIGPGIIATHMWYAGGFSFTLTREEIARCIIGFAGMGVCLLVLTLKNRKCDYSKRH